MICMSAWLTWPLLVRTSVVAINESRAVAFQIGQSHCLSISTLNILVASANSKQITRFRVQGYHSAIVEFVLFKQRTLHRIYTNPFSLSLSVWVCAIVYNIMCFYHELVRLIEFQIHVLSASHRISTDNVFTHKQTGTLIMSTLRSCLGIPRHSSNHSKPFFSIDF